MISHYISSITWVQFFIAFLIVAAIWVLWVYKDVLLGKSPPPSDHASPKKRIWQVKEEGIDSGNLVTPSVEKGRPVPFNTLDFEDNKQMADEGAEEIDEFGLMEELIGKIEKVIVEYNKSGKEEILHLLKPVFEDYSILDRPPFKIAIHNFIVRLSLKEAGIVFTDADTDSLWV